MPKKGKVAYRKPGRPSKSRMKAARKRRKKK